MCGGGSIILHFSPFGFLSLQRKWESEVDKQTDGAVRIGDGFRKPLEPDACVVHRNCRLKYVNPLSIKES